MNTQKLKTQIKVDMKANNTSDLAPKRKKSATEIMTDFDKWIEKIQNVHRGNEKKMCNAYEIVIT